VLDCAKAALLVEQGELAGASEIVGRAAGEHGDNYTVTAAVELVRSLIAASVGADR
jgi:hypothetical protein